ncbi:MAG: 6-carboxytetrahydropterin synthase QueD [Synergistaceae bacterium]|jgi:6-pyruvoyltetrahydropterin/6-carboxytetrahydropterin synthase|nr:6-carboxytetrahydropterin synthase QueD [Synergistaceae bacterium]
MLLKREFSFDAAHRLEHYHGRCENLHGHTYRMIVEIEGSPDAEGMIVDFIQVKETVEREVISKLDHSYLNDTIDQPSAENIARFVFERLEPLLKGPNYSLSAVQVWETPKSSVVFRRGDMQDRK